MLFASRVIVGAGRLRTAGLDWMAMLIWWPSLSGLYKPKRLDQICLKVFLEHMTWGRKWASLFTVNLQWPTLQQGKRPKVADCPQGPQGPVLCLLLLPSPCWLWGCLANASTFLCGSRRKSVASPGWRETDGVTRLSRLSSLSSLHDFFLFSITQTKIVSSTTVYKLGNQQGPAAQHKELYSTLSNNSHGNRIWKRMDICVTESLRCNTWN